ncbi:MAG: LysM peptidoglycan-binding domain-containing protein [Desulfuromonas sp.]|nr:LysM peptidoglycan-binding domain-containing protein [Desulfuromonas sp.]
MMRSPYLALLYSICFCVVLSGCSAMSVFTADSNGASEQLSTRTIASGVDSAEHRDPALNSELNACVTVVSAAVDETEADTQLLTEDVLPPAETGVAVAPEPLFDFPVVENDQVRFLIKRYTGSGRVTFTRWLQRSSKYLPLMREIFAREGLPRDLATLAMVESGFNSNAHSWANAVGYWQFIESTGNMYGLDNTWWYDERRDIEKATLAAARYLKDLHQRFDGNWYLAVASYNAGPGKISRAVRKYNTTDFWELSKGSYLREETKNYVPKLLAALLISKQPGKYGFCDLNYEQELEFDTVVLPEATDLELIAELTDASYAQIKELNPELKRWCTPPKVENYRLRLPVGSAVDFSDKYAAVPSTERARYKRHQIKSGDTLQHIAKRYGIRVDDIVELNKISNPRALRIGQNLILPLNRDFSTLAVSELTDDYQRSHRRNYKVRPGDSLWSIARKCDVTEKQLRVWNRLGWSNVIQPGKILLVSAPKRASSPPSTQQKLVYKVRSGDTLWGIGQRFAVHTKQIRRWNGLSEQHILQPGDKLTLLVADKRRT